MTLKKISPFIRTAGFLLGALFVTSGCGGSEANCYASIDALPQAPSSADFQVASVALQSAACSDASALEYSTSNSTLMCESDGEGGPWICWTGDGGDCFRLGGVWWCGFIER